MTDKRASSIADGATTTAENFQAVTPLSRDPIAQHAIEIPRFRAIVSIQAYRPV